MKIRISDSIVLLFAGLGGSLVIYYWSDSWPGAAGVCMLAIAFSLAIVSRRWKKLKHGDIPDFLTVFLLFQVANKLMTIISLAFGDEARTVYDLADLVGPVYNFRAESVHLIAMVLFTIGWLFVERHSQSKRDLQSRQYSIGALAVFYVASSLVVLILYISAGVVSTGLLSAFMKYSALGAVAIMLVSNTPYGLGGSKSMLTLSLLAPYFYLAMISGTKGEMIVASLPVVVAGIGTGWKWVMVVLTPLALFMLAIGIPLSQEMRSANWESAGGTEEIDLSQGLTRVMSRYASGDGLSMIHYTIIAFCNRASSAESGGLVMRYAERDGFLGFETLKLLPAVFVPRILWPDKPSFRPGAWFTWYRGRASSPESATSATAMMLGTEFYWSFGAAGLLILMCLGGLYAIVWRALRRISTLGLVGFAGMFALLGMSVRFEESNALYAVSGPIAYVAYAYAFVWVERTGRSVLVTLKNRL